jgi:PAS domain S-box-containing protein
MQAPNNLLPETLKVLESIAKINNDGLWIWNLGTNEVSRFGEEFYNAFGNTLTSLSPPEDWEKLIHPDDKSRVVKNYKAAIENPEILRTDETYQVLKTDGTYADILDHAYISRNENGKATTVYGIASDITFRKKNDIEREMRISELTKANSSLKQFSYIISHNLRTPISNLIGLGSIIDESKIEDPLIQKTVEKYKLATLNLNKNVNGLFELLVQNTNPEKQVQEVKLDDVFKQVMDSVETKITESGAEISADFSEGNIVEFNPVYMHSIFLNFLTNTLKYRDPERDLKVKVFTEKKDGCLLLHFSDNGLGIDLDKYGDKVFGLYQKFHNHPDSKGLGLHIVATQVKASGGKVWVTSEPNKGTTFSIQFKKIGHAE